MGPENMHVKEATHKPSFMEVPEQVNQGEWTGGYRAPGGVSANELVLRVRQDVLGQTDMTATRHLCAKCHQLQVSEQLSGVPVFLFYPV